MIAGLFNKICLGVIAYTALDNCIEVLRFSGPSMEPTLHEHDVGIAEKITSYKSLRRGDIVALTAPDDPSMTLCKRIVGLEGDKVTYNCPNMKEDDEDGEDYITVRRFVPRGHVWLEGDNASRSYDSRMYGPVPLGLVRNRIFVKRELKSSLIYSCDVHPDFQHLLITKHSFNNLS